MIQHRWFILLLVCFGLLSNQVKAAGFLNRLTSTVTAAAGAALGLADPEVANSVVRSTEAVNNLMRNGAATFEQATAQVRELTGAAEAERKERMKFEAAHQKEMFDKQTTAAATQAQADRELRDRQHIAEQARLVQQDQNRLQHKAHQADLNRQNEVEKARTIVNTLIADTLGSPRNMAIGATAVSGVVASYFASPMVFRQIERLLIKPKLVDETNCFTGDWESYKRLFGIKSAVKSNVLNYKMILSDVMRDQLNTVVQSARNSRKNGGLLPIVLLTGQPGLGKTMFAKKLAYNANMKYVLMTGAAFDQFENGDDIVELRRVFDWARGWGLVLVIDEAEICLENRATIQKHRIAVLNELLAKTGELTDDILIVFITNRPEVIDPAIISRVQRVIDFALPTKIELDQMIKEYLEKLMTRKNKSGKRVKIDVSMITPAMVQKLAVRFEAVGFTGRDIFNFVNDLRDMILAQDKPVLTAKLFDMAVEGAIKKKMLQNKNSGDERKNESVVPAAA